MIKRANETASFVLNKHHYRPGDYYNYLSLQGAYDTLGIFHLYNPETLNENVNIISSKSEKKKCFIYITKIFSI